TTAALYPALCVAGAFDPPRAAVVETVATSAATPASAIQRETFTCPPSQTFVSASILTRGRRNRKPDFRAACEPELELGPARQARDDARMLDHVRPRGAAPPDGFEVGETLGERHGEGGRKGIARAGRVDDGRGEGWHVLVPELRAVLAERQHLRPACAAHRLRL